MLLCLNLSLSLFYFILLLVTNLSHFLQFFLQFFVFRLKLFNFFFLLWAQFLQNLLKFISILGLSVFLRYFLRVHLWYWLSTSIFLCSTSLLNLRFYSIYDVFFIFFKLILDFSFLFHCLFQLSFEIVNLRSRYFCLSLALWLTLRLTLWLTLRLTLWLTERTLIIGKIFDQIVLTLQYLVFNESSLSA